MSDATTPQRPVALDIRDLRRTFVQGDATITVLRGITAKLYAGEVVALLGPSGAGKSTLLQAAGLLEGGFEGAIIIDGVDAATMDADERTTLRRNKMGFVYQFHHLLPDFSAIENVVLPQLLRDTPEAEAQSRAEQLLTNLGLGERLHHKPAKLSGGEQQRVAVARALANRPALVLADEPTGNLDEATADRVFSEFVALVRENNTAAIVATHNEALAQRTDRIWRLSEGRISEHPTRNAGADHGRL